MMIIGVIKAPFCAKHRRRPERIRNGIQKKATMYTEARIADNEKSCVGTEGGSKKLRQRQSQSVQLRLVRRA